MNKKFSFINNLLEKYDIAFFEISDCYDKNKEFVDDAKKIFECNNSEEISLTSLVPELVCPEISSELQKQLYKNLNIPPIETHDTEEDVYKKRVLLITAMYFNTSFYVHSFNWCFFLENDAAQSAQPTPKVIVLNRIWEFDAIAASSGMWVDLDNGKPIVIDEYGKISIRARRNSHIIKIQFLSTNADSDLEKLEFDLITKSNNQLKHIVLDAANEYKARVEDIDCAKGYTIKNVSYVLK